MEKLESSPDNKRLPKNYFMTKIAIIVSAIVVSVMTAKAATETFTANYDNQTLDLNTVLNLTKFDTSLGTLNSIQVTLDAATSISGTVQNTSSGPYGSGSYIFDLSNYRLGSSSIDTALKTKFTGSAVLKAYSLTVDLSGLGVGDTMILNNVGNDTGIDNESVLSRSYTFTSADSLYSLVQGTGTFGIDASTITGSQTFLVPNGANSSINLTGVGSIDATVVYNFTPVPEPSTVAILGGGFASLLLFLRRRSA